MTEEEIKALALQLGCPQGEMGIAVAGHMHQNNLQMTLHTIESLELKSNDSLLELGPGAAAHVAQLMETSGIQNYTALDISELMVEEAKKLNAGYLQENKASFHLYDGTHIPFPDASFDKVMTVNTIYFWENPIKLLKEIQRVMKPKAVFSICFGKKDFMEQLPFTKYGFKLYSPKEAKELVTAAGFEFINTTDLTDQISIDDEMVMERFFNILKVRKK